MKNKLVKKIILIICIIRIISIIWMTFIYVDCIRISNFHDKPLIVINEKNYDNVRKIEDIYESIEVGEYGTIYTGLGYTKKRYQKWQLDKSLSRAGYSVYLFGFIPVSGFEFI